MCEVAQTITLNPNVITAGTANDPNPNDIKPPLGIITAADPPSNAGMAVAWTDASHTKAGIGLSVSEPLPNDPAHPNSYYKEPTVLNPGTGLVEAYGGHATLFRAPAAQRAGNVFSALAPVNLRLHQRLKQEFDPQGIFNAGRMYPGL